MPNYDFDANRDLILSIILGDLNPDGLKERGVGINVQYRYDTFTEEVVLGIQVTVERVQKNFNVREVIQRMALAQSNMDPEQLIWRTYHALARKMSRTLFEFDPRIGLPLNDRFPDCPLFDPPNVGLPYAKYLNMTDPERALSSMRETFISLTTCPFCQGRIHPYDGSHKKGVWCGGNVGFAHEACAPWVTPRS